jgi:N-acetylglucosamine malate deacetylase 2
VIGREQNGGLMAAAQPASAMRDPAERWARRLAGGGTIDEPVVILVAHPDDETLWVGSALRRLTQATLILLTDGAPHDMGDARRLGFATREAYGRHRAGELGSALAALGFAGRLLCYEIPDQEAVFQIEAVLPRLRRDTAGAGCIVTHPYEGGHPDHDAAALLASRLALPVVEFACYARVGGERVFGRFVDDPGRAEAVRVLDAEDRVRVDRALAAHSSQAGVFGSWRPAFERWRAAPYYDFGRAPPGEVCLYDGFGWALTQARWRAIAAGERQAAA